MTPRSGTWSAGGILSDKRTGEVALRLRGDRGVLVMGGLDRSPAITAAVDIGQSPPDDLVEQCIEQTAKRCSLPRAFSLQDPRKISVLSMLKNV
jgi:hypothetical protein